MYGVNIYTDLGQQELPDCFHAKMNPMSCDLGQKADRHVNNFQNFYMFAKSVEVICRVNFAI